MAVPIRNIYYLLCYAYGHLQDVDTAPSDAELGDRTENLFAHVLCRTIGQLHKKGLERRYIEKDEELRGLRGKVMVSHTMSRALLRRGELSCQFEELSSDILENQMLKAAVAWLGRHSRLNEKYRRLLAGAFRSLSGVSDVPLRSIRFADLRRHPPRQDYALGLHLARLLAEGLLPEQREGDGSFVPFERDDARMGQLFEDFVRGFVSIELPEATFLPSGSSWDVVGDPTSAALVPTLRRDVPFVMNGRRRIVECKFYKSPLQSQYGTDKLRSEHLYQLYSYLVNDRPEAEGLLLYAATDRKLRVDVTLTGRTIAVRTLDLTRDWAEIYRELGAILREPVRVAA